MERYICIHGHFYQPPRENPWLEEVEVQDSAYPYHDWNERITAECYAPNTAARVLGDDNRIVDIVNNFSRISFNVGPTLLSWMERHQPEVYEGILVADQESMRRFGGHGSAIAQVYNHMIMPLANDRDKHTQVLWGIRDFEARFKRFPEGMWLSETAVDTQTLEILAEAGIKFTILAPRQAKRVKSTEKGARWHGVEGSRIDPKQAYTCVLPSGKTIALFFYDGPVSQDIAFAGLLNSGEAFANRLMGAFESDRSTAQLVHIATDGESYGHHHRHGDMALAFCLHHVEKSDSARLTCYGEFLEKHPPSQIVEIFENSSWSCVHGIERWRENCGCNTGRVGWTQAWRRPLRDALDMLRDRLVGPFEQQASQYFQDPWNVRNEYVRVVLNRERSFVERFLATHAHHELSPQEQNRALKLLELQRNAMLMYTSCGWFFDEISGIETTQVLQYASKAIQLAEDVFEDHPEQDFVDRLAAAPSNVLENGAKAYELYAKPVRIDLLRVGAHYGIFSLFVSDPTEITLFSHTLSSDVYKRLESGKFRLAIGKVKISSNTTWDEKPISFAVLHFGDHNLNGGVRDYMGDEAFAAMQAELIKAFERADIPEVIKLIGKHFGTHNYALWHLFRDEQRKVISQILATSMENAESSLRTIYENNYSVMSFLHSLSIPIPESFKEAALGTMNADVSKTLKQEEIDLPRLESISEQIRKWSFRLDTRLLPFEATQWLNRAMSNLVGEPEDPKKLHRIAKTIEALHSMGIDPDLWNAQNRYFALGRAVAPGKKSEAAEGNKQALSWIEAFETLGSYLNARVSL